MVSQSAQGTPRVVAPSGSFALQRRSMTPGRSEAWRTIRVGEPFGDSPDINGTEALARAGAAAAVRGSRRAFRGCGRLG